MTRGIPFDPSVDLDAPLGRCATVARRRRSVPISLPQALAGALAGFAAVFLGWLAIADDPLGGEPAARAALTAPDAVPRPLAASPGGPPPRGNPVLADPATTGSVVAPPPGSTTVTIIDGSSGKRRDVTVGPAMPGDSTPRARRPMSSR